MNTKLASLVLVVLTAGCVSAGRYDRAVAETDTTRAQLAQKKTELAQTSARLDETAFALDVTKKDLDAKRAEIARLEALIDAASRGAAADKQSSDQQLGELKKRLEDLRKQQAAAEARAAVFREVALKLKKQVDAGDLAIVIRDGRMVLQLPNDVLFDTGKTDIKPAGKEALEAIAGVLGSMPERHFQVAGHTDNVPIHNERFASNWELSAGRSLGVVHFLIDHGAGAATLSAAGYGETDPVAPNDDAGGRRRNRRTEITLVPNISELVPVP